MEWEGKGKDRGGKETGREGEPARIPLEWKPMLLGSAGVWKQMSCDCG